MKIRPTNYKCYTPQFRSTRQCVTDNLGRVINCHYTNLNRKDVDWEKLALMLAQRFKKQDNVRINLFGCSDGSDAYTLKIALRNTLGELSSKFFIEASDISPSLITKAQKGEILLYEKDYEFIESKNSKHFFKRDYSKKIKKMRGINFYPHIIDKELRENMTFSVKDVRKEVQKHDFSNEVFIFRNGWTFMDLNTQNEIIKNLAKNSNEKTLCLIGQSDLFKSNACEFFQCNKFKGIESEIFTKAETDYPSVSIGMPAQKSKYPEFILFEKA